MEDYLSKIVQEASAKLEQEKERLIKLRVTERVGEEIDFIKEATKRFPRIGREFYSTDQSEHWYWNDGSEKGLHLISFYQDFEQDLMSKDYKFNLGFKYR
jgi:hypothetical protein